MLLKYLSLAGNEKLVGGYPLSDLIYPTGISKLYTSRNMMRFWSNFAKNGNPGTSTNSVKWNHIIQNRQIYFYDLLIIEVI